MAFIHVNSVDFLFSVDLGISSPSYLIEITLLADTWLSILNLLDTGRSSPGAAQSSCLELVQEAFAKLKADNGIFPVISRGLRTREDGQRNTIMYSVQGWRPVSILALPYVTPTPKDAAAVLESGSGILYVLTSEHRCNGS